MKIIEIFGLARSGHHAITNWIIKNLCGDECAMNWKLNIMKNGLFYINEGNLDEELTLKYIEDQKDKIRVLIISYENCPLDYTVLNDKRKYDSFLSINNPNVINFSQNYRIMFIRDFYDNLASRIKSNELNLKKSREGVIIPGETGQQFIDLWKSFANSYNTNGFLSLKFEDWLNSKTTRNLFLEKITGYVEIYDNNVKGTHSSFGDDKVLDRIHQINVDDETIRLVENDNELHYLIGKLKYGYKKI
jgi:hypothetical protein